MAQQTRYARLIGSADSFNLQGRDGVLMMDPHAECLNEEFFMGDFASKTEATVRDGVVVFSMETGGVTRQFEMSSDVLQEHFGAADDSGSELLKAFEKARDELEAMAKKAQWVPIEGPIELGTGDFGEGRA